MKHLMTDFRIFYVSALFGALITFASVLLLPSQGIFRAIEAALLGGILVVVPLALPLTARIDQAPLERQIFKALAVIQPCTALLTAWAFFLPASVAAAVLSSSWLLATGLIGLIGLLQIWKNRFRPIEQLCASVGLLYLPVGGSWLVLSRLGIDPFGFGNVIVILTAVHFHYAGFAAPILSGQVGQRLAQSGPRPIFLPIAVGVIAGTPLVAIGITFSPIVEMLGAFVLAGALLGLALLTLLVVVPPLKQRIARGFLVVSSVSVVVTMGLACAYAIGEFAGVSIVAILTMVQLHGWLNAVGFVLCGLLAWTLLNEHAG